MYRLFVIAVVVFGLVGSARGDITPAQADFDGSGKVDITDFLQFVAAFGSQQGQSAYDAKYDLDGSGAVDIADFLLFVNVFGQTVQQVPVVPVDSVEGDRAALVALYNATDGDNWRDNTNWLSDKPLGHWHDVYTNEQGRVVKITLIANQLSGTLPPELGNLTKLKELFLDRNQLSGPIPPELGKLTNLEYGSFTRTNLCVPYALKDLRFYNYSQHDGTYLPKCPDPRDRAALVALYHATDGDNWRKNDNWLSDKLLDDWYGVKTNKHDHVVRLSLRLNRLSGSIPPEIGNLSNLTFLYLNKNQLSGPIPPEIGNLTKLYTLFLYNNHLTGAIPPELGNLSELRELYLENNQLSGSIPSTLGNLSTLTHLYLQGNQLSGPIPPEIGNLSNLEILNLDYNQLSGPIPPELGYLNRISQLNLANNQLSGPIPLELRNIKYAWVFLSGNPNLCMPSTLRTWRHYNTQGVKKCSE